MSGADAAAGADTADGGEPAARRGRPSPPGLPRSLFVWLALLALTFVAGRALDQGEPRQTRREAVADYVPSAADFQGYVAAELNVRIALGSAALARTLPAAGGAAAAGPMKSAIPDALKTYRRLADKAVAPGLNRRILILERYQGRPLDEARVAGDLSADLKARGKSGAEVQAEQRFWRSVYGAKPAMTPSRLNIPEEERRIREMQLGLLEDRLLADLYAASGDKARAQAAEARLNERARSFYVRNILGSLILLAALAVGVITLLVYLIASLSRRWTMVRRVPTLLPRLPWGVYVDGFVAYLALVRIVALLIQLAVGRYLPDPGRGAVLGVTLLGQVLPALLAATYFFASLLRHAERGNRAHGEGWATESHPLAEIGVTTGGRFWGHVGYGVLGYCAALPLVAALGAISRAIFQDNPNTAPNLALPLITSERETAGRVVLFLLVSFGAPLFEELFFRGALYTGLRARFGWVSAVLLSSVLFALLHPIQDWLPIIGLGMALAVMREMRQSLVPSITAHFLQNTVTFFTLSTLFAP